MKKYGFEYSLGFVGMCEWPTIIPYYVEANSFLSAFRKFQKELPEYFKAIVSVIELPQLNMEDYNDFFD